MTERQDLKGVWSRFEDLSAREVHDLLRLRQDIFVVEQDCAFPDIDGKDPEALHFRLLDSETGHLAGALRAFLPQGHQGDARIGRVVMDPHYRGGGRGRLLMQAGLDKIRELAPDAEIHLSAQAHLEDFYASLGFQRTSENYLEDGIWHLDMICRG